MPRLVFISDTHGFYEETNVPDGDILIHSGDFGKRGHLSELQEFNDWMASHDHPHKIFVAGNHDWCFERELKASKKIFKDVIYLQDTAVKILGLHFYGSPWQPRFFDWAFNLDRGKPLAEKWSMIPESTDVLITHTPPYGIMDVPLSDRPCGCKDLAARIKKVKPKVHAFGHIHECWGKEKRGKTIYVNASICDREYEPVHEAIVVDL